MLIDGVDVRRYNMDTLRDKIAVITQESQLFSMSIKDNIAWGKPDAGDNEIVTAARDAQADDLISARPQGYDSPVAERGSSFSGGQKQRISIARALLKNADIIIFDDSTGALDLKTEAELYKAVDVRFPNSTKIIVAQRIATARRADRIAVLADKGVAATGTHAELMAHSAIYREIYKSQFGEEEQNDRR